MLKNNLRALYSNTGTACESVAYEDYLKLYNGEGQRYCEFCLLKKCKKCGESTEDEVSNIAPCSKCGTKLCVSHSSQWEGCGLRKCQRCGERICEECNDSLDYTENYFRICASSGYCGLDVYCRDCIGDEEMCGSCGAYYCGKSPRCAEEECRNMLPCLYCGAKSCTDCDTFKHCGTDLDSSYRCTSVCDECYEKVKPFVQCERCGDEFCDDCMRAIQSNRTKENRSVCSTCCENIMDGEKWDAAKWDSEDEDNEWEEV